MRQICGASKGVKDSHVRVARMGALAGKRCVSMTEMASLEDACGGHTVWTDDEI